MAQLKEVLKDETLLAHIADQIAAFVTEKINARIDQLEKALNEKAVRIKQREQNVDELDVHIDNLEQYS